MVGKPRQDAWLTDRLELWVDGDVPWPKVWTYFDLAPGGTHRMYYNADDPVFQPFLLYNEYNQTGGLSLEGTVISPNGAVVASDARIGGLWSSRAGVFNHYVDEGRCPAGTVVDVSVHTEALKFTVIGAAVKWLALYPLRVRGRGLSESLPIERVVEYNRQGEREITYEVVEAFDWTYETA